MSRPANPALSPREKQVYDLYCKGLNTTEIARVCGITRSAVTQAKHACRRKGKYIAMEPKYCGPQKAQAAENRRNIINAIVDGYSTVKTIAQHVHLSESSVADHMGDLRDERIVNWHYGCVTLTPVGREQYKPDVYDEIYSDDALCSCGGPSLERFEWLFDQIAAGRNG